ncbi:MAG: hypothetical protein M1829_003567 [Trizodia sp. TS-e1964]|nr:MAG: hypothetical protein M1829_003567 [Trizodia sp. TS-e1964]
MDRRYSLDELLSLKESPLVCKPKGFTPTEEWMGTSPEPAQRKATLTRGKMDDLSLQSDISARKPAYFETRHISRTSTINPDDIILGPSKTAFASASSSRNQSKALESQPKRASFPHGEEDDHFPEDRYHTRSKSLKDRDKTDVDGVGFGVADARFGLHNGRKASKEEIDADGWISVKPRKSFGTEDGERFPRRNGGRDRERERDLDREKVRDRERAPRETRDGEWNETSRRNGAGRGRAESSPWTRDQDSLGSREKDSSRDDYRDREWRDKDRRTDRGDRGERGERPERGDRDWNRGSRGEKDPEWMDSPSRDEHARGRTQEDFQRWKLRMKASNAATPTEERPAEEDLTEEARTDEAQPEKITGEKSVNASEHKVKEPEAIKPAKVIAEKAKPLIVDAGLEKFFGLWTEPGLSEEYGQSIGMLSSKKDPSKAPVSKASRFTSFFSPPEEIARRQTESKAAVKAPAAQESQSHQPQQDDKEGFKRILQMLGNKTIGPGNTTPFIPAKPLGEGQFQQPLKDEPTSATKAMFSFGTKDPIVKRKDSLPASPPGFSPELSARFSDVMKEKSPTLDDFPNDSSTRKPKGHGENSSSRDSDFLLHLMQNSRPDIPPPNPLQEAIPYGYLPGNPQGHSQGPLPGLPQGFAQGPPHGLGQGQQLGHPLGHSMPPNFMGGLNEPPKLSGPNHPQPPFLNDPSIASFQRPLPPGPYIHNVIQRPPGLDQLPPIWPNPQPPHPQRHIAPPPGLGNNIRGPMPPFPPPPGIPYPVFGGPNNGMNHNPFPPSMPPPGFYGGPPPGFPNPFQHAELMGLPSPGGPNSIHGPMGPQFNQFGDGMAYGRNGRGGPPGQYPRYP